MRIPGILILIICFVQLPAQQIYNFSLEQAVAFARENNFDFKNKLLDVESARQRVKESTSIGLPQVDATISYTDYINLPVQIIPGEFFIDPNNPDETPPDQEVQFGTKYNSTAEASLSQLLFSGQYIVGLQTASVFLDKTRKDLVKEEQLLQQSISTSYFSVLINKASLDIIDSTLLINRQLLDETRALYSEGFVEESDVDQLDILVADLEANRLSAFNQYFISQAYLKYYLGMEPQDSLTLTDGLDALLEDINYQLLFNEPFDISKNIDYQVLKKNQELAHAQWRLAKTEYMPSLYAVLATNYQAQRREWDFFDANGKWFNTTFVGIQMDIPIFSSGERMAKVKQAKIGFEKTLNLESQTKMALDLQYQTTRNNTYNAFLVQQNREKNRNAAQKIYNNTGVKYREGISSSLDLLNTYNQYLTSERDYLLATLELLNLSVELQLLLQEVEE